MKKPLLILDKFDKKIFTNAYGFSWMIQALNCIQENQKVIYDLLPEREDYKNTVQTDLEICNNCKKNDLQSSGSCSCYCHSLIPSANTIE